MLHTPEGARIMLIAGGSGQFGKVILADKPTNTFVVNVSKNRVISGEDVVTCQFDLLREPEKAFRHLATLLPYVDTFVYAAYSPTFTSFEHIKRARFLHEYELNVYTATLCLRLCAERFWKEKKEENHARSRKAILISSAAAFGKTVRPELASYSATKAALNALGPYVHDYLFETYGTSAHVLAPGSLADETTRAKLVRRFWKLAAEPHGEFTLERIV